MAQSDLKASASLLNERILKLTEVHNQMKGRIRKLEEENAILKKELETERDNLSKAKSDIEFLTVSYRLADNAESVITTRRTLKRLIRTIDKCIRMINEE